MLFSFKLVGSQALKFFILRCVLFAQTLSSEEALECSLCYERYDDNKRCPRLLSNCGHTFCTHCLEQLLKDGTITCPQDRKNVKVTAGVGGLPKNFALLDVLLASSHKQPDTSPVLCDTCGDERHPATSCCLECKENMCDVAAQFHTRYKLSRDHRVIPLQSLKPVHTLLPSLSSVQSTTSLSATSTKIVAR